jgi:hypothetical protein
MVSVVFHDRHIYAPQGLRVLLYAASPDRAGRRLERFDLISQGS